MGSVACGFPKSKCVAVVDARCPPAENPITPILSGNTPNSFARERTTFIEAILSAAGGTVLVARCVRDDALRQARETAPKNHPELRRYRLAGASGAALFAYPANNIGWDAFFITELMTDYSQAVLLEGDNPLRFTP